MNPESSGNKIPDPFETKDFGILYPVGFLVAAFPKQESARQVQQKLVARQVEQE
ncbi:MAG: hypothetical protein IPP10_02020 [Candidatus Competibacteraceae bacterium]|jgi:hypothetical protein|nr:hypothetical protein [Candidatus Competibacteraceae bacterium]MBK7984179.1 hypothetical protein [Candidatus Competibacteraceae bacterium]MBK8896149.1 hypothetical protein [Candidatus Competibacteraceae bacterium]MBK9950324.1 hypothetical protein [Candidatus Competibacteraceae bacterium]